MVTVATGPNQKLIYTESFVAGGDLQTKQFHYVKLSANRKVVICAAATDKPVGILQNKPDTDEEAEVLIIGRGKLTADVTLSAGDLLMTSADGQGAVAASTGYNTGQVVQGAAAGELAEVTVQCASLSLIA
jgi:hypothetical protein